MIVIVKIEADTPTGWIVATDIDDARRQAAGVGRDDIATLLYTRPEPRPGRYDVGNGYWMLVT